MFSLNDLNPPQKDAVTHDEGPLLILAGAGSGKTRVITYRIAHLIEQGVKPWNILAVTFTNKAAGEMKARVTALSQSEGAGVWISTFHSFCAQFLRTEGSRLGLDRSFTIYDDDDQKKLVRDCLRELNLDDKKIKPGGILNRISREKDQLMDAESFSIAALGSGDPQKQMLAGIYSLYQKKLESALALDFGDLIMKSVEFLQAYPDLRNKYQERFHHILVDEYQDTNRLQAELVRAMAATHDNVMAVGDDAQSIYGFRGATFRNIMDFPKLFPGTQLFKLEENYRSTQPILTLANEVINLAAEKYPKTLFTRKLHGPAPVLAKAVDEHTQSRFVAQRVLELREEGVPVDEIAVLFRSSFHSFDLEIELARRNIPFVKRGGFKFIETAHVKDILAHLRVVENHRDAVSWHRLLTLIEGVGPKKSQDLIRAIVHEQGSGTGAAGRLPPFSLDALKAAAAKGSGASAQGLQALARVLEAITRDTTMTPGAQVSAICAYYLPILMQQYDDHPKRMKDLEHLATIAERYRKVESFLADLALEPPDKSVVDVEAEQGDDERLVLSTIHSAKGLEWHSVFVIWALDGKFPSLYAFTADEDLEEERRLFYVAITRAKHNLYLTYPVDVYDRASGLVLSKPSRFLDEVRRDCLDSWSLIEEDD